MLTSMTINGLRGIAHGELKDLAPLTVIVGANGAGKSTILDAINIAVNPSTGEALSIATRRRQLPNDFLRWILPKGRLSEGTELIATNAAETCRVTLQGTSIESITWAVTNSDSQGKRTGAYNGQITVHGFNTDGRIHLGIKSVRLIDSHGKDVLRPIHDLHTLAVEAGFREEERRLVTSILPGAEHIEVLAANERPVAHVVYKDYSVPVSLVGDGIEVVIRLALEAMILQDGILLLEEPEVHLHPAALRHAAKVIVDAVQRGVQVILSTHSLELIDNLVASWESDADCSKMAVFRVSLEEGNLKVSRIPGDRVVALRSTIEDDLR